MTLLQEIGEAIQLCREEVQRGDPMSFAATMLRTLEKWREAVLSGHYDERDRRRAAGGTFRYLSDDGNLFEHPLAQKILKIANRYMRNDI